MDGLLIDSEPVWRKAEEQIFRGVGINLSDELAEETTGMRNDETVHYWYERYPWQGPTEQEVESRIDNLVVSLISQGVTVKSGVYELIGLCERLQLPMAIASSSSDKIIQAGVDKLGIGQKLKVIHSAYAESHGKPNPAVYLTTAQKLGVEPDECLVLEDSVDGVLAAKAATMHCIAVPAPEEQTDKRFGIADAVLSSLQDVTENVIHSV